MVRLFPTLDGNSRFGLACISLPLVPALIDGSRYVLEVDLPPKPCRDFRRLRQGKEPRPPSLRTLVKWALTCESAEQLGKKIKKRYDQQHQGRYRNGEPGHSHDEAAHRNSEREIAHLLGDP
jgi:hypothetical protein